MRPAPRRPGLPVAHRRLQGRAARCGGASSWGTTSASSTTTSRTPTRSAGIGPRCGRSGASRWPSTPATRSSRCRGWRCIGPRWDGFSDHRVLELMKVYDETCLALCEGQYLDISFERRTDVTVDAYMEMIGKKTAALLGASVQAGAILATDDDAIAEAYRALRLRTSAWPSRWPMTSRARSGPRPSPARRRRATSASARRRCPWCGRMQHAREADRGRLTEIYLDGVRATDGRGPAAGGPADDGRRGGRGAGHPRAQRRPRARAGRGATLSRPRRWSSSSGCPCPPEGSASCAALVRSMIAA